MTQTEVLADIAEREAGIDAATFTAEFMAPETRNETFRDFLVAQQAGVQGFPCLVAGNERDGFAQVTNGFRPIDGLPEAIEVWLRSEAEETRTGT